MERITISQMMMIFPLFPSTQPCQHLPVAHVDREQGQHPEERGERRRLVLHLPVGARGRALPEDKSEASLTDISSFCRA